jgi:hypothetical protein
MDILSLAGFKKDEHAAPNHDCTQWTSPMLKNEFQKCFYFFLTDDSIPAYGTAADPPIVPIDGKSIMN